MPDILIRGMEMPTKGNPLTVLVYPDGTATWKDREYEAVELPEHGDLIDLDAQVTKQVYDEHHMAWVMKTKTVRQWLNIDFADMPVVIPSNKEETEWNEPLHSSSR